MKTIEQIRLENYRRLLSELAEDLGHEPSQAEAARAFKISKVYAHQIETGKRLNIASDAARKIELAQDKEPGWMDNDHDFWPFESIRVDRYNHMPPHWRGMAEKAARDVLEEWERQANSQREA